MNIGGIPLHLRGEVRDIFFEWLRSYRPDLVPRYERAVRARRLRGEGGARADLRRCCGRGAGRAAGAGNEEDGSVRARRTGHGCPSRARRIPGARCSDRHRAEDRRLAGAATSSPNFIPRRRSCTARRRRRRRSPAWSSSSCTASVVSPLSGSVSVTSAAMPEARIAPSDACSRSSAWSATSRSPTSGSSPAAALTGLHLAARRRASPRTGRTRRPRVSISSANGSR